MTNQPVLEIRDLSIDARTPNGPVPVLKSVSFAVKPGETLCVAGGSGSGKSITALSIMRLLPPTLHQRSGSIVLAGREITTLPERAMRRLRGGEIAMVFQDAMTALNPVMTVGAQVVEAIRAHGAAVPGGGEARARAMLDAVRLAQPARCMEQYPHELSGGMRQRVMIAMALSCRPKVLIADEPTTALDNTVQAQILELMRDLRKEFGTALVLITHDMGVVSEMADRVLVLGGGRLVEQGARDDILVRPRATYTRDLLDAVPRLGALTGTEGPPRVTQGPPASRTSDPALLVRNLQVSYADVAGRRGRPHPPALAVKNVDLVIAPGETLGLVGESGSGKSTIGKAVLGLVPFRGEVVIDGTPIAGLSAGGMRLVRRRAQMIFQDPYASLDPRMTVGDAVAEPLHVHRVGTRSGRREQAVALLKRVHLSPDHATRYPHELSGGQRQRVCIARALALEPKLIVADESVSALDVSVRAHVLDLLLALQEELGLAYLFISHDMAVIERMSHSVAVLAGGSIVEQGTRRAIFESPRHPYTRALMDAVPVLARPCDAGMPPWRPSRAAANGDTP